MRLSKKSPTTACIVCGLLIAADKDGKPKKHKPRFGVGSGRTKSMKNEPGPCPGSEFAGEA